jgi:Protein of unknown function (DUF1353)
MTVLSRRSALFTLGALSAATLTRAAGPAAAASSPAPVSGEREVDVRAWMNVWINRRRATNGALHLGRFLDPMYFVLEEIAWTPEANAPPGLPKVTVPPGFVTDLASIPQFFWCILRPDGAYTFPAIVHDYLYWTQTVTRDAADEIFSLGLEEFKKEISSATRSALVEGVRAGGQSAWDRNKALREAGERRVLKKRPEDAKTTWKEWKADPANF